jgi:hypothetical protein
MPWRDVKPMEQRLEFIREYGTGLFTMTELVAHWLLVAHRCGSIGRTEAAVTINGAASSNVDLRLRP